MVEKFLRDEGRKVERSSQSRMSRKIRAHNKSVVLLRRGVTYGTTSGERLPPEERLTKKRDFERIFKIGIRKNTNQLTIICVPSSITKIGVILSHKIKGTVIRNKLKRRLRDIYRKNKINFKGECIILAYPGAETMDYSNLREMILRLLDSQ